MTRTECLKKAAEYKEQAESYIKACAITGDWKIYEDAMVESRMWTRLANAHPSTRAKEIRSWVLRA